MNDLKKLFGNRLRQLRKANNLTQEQLAEKLDISLPNISYIETGKTYPSVETQEKICTVLGINYQELYMFYGLPDIEQMRKELISAMQASSEITQKLYRFFKFL